MVEINLLKKYPKTKRNVDQRAEGKTFEQRAIARRFSKEYFDGERDYGYGGYNYHAKFWTDVVQDFIKRYNLTKDSKVLDIGCGKGFMLYDLMLAVPGIKIKGIDISKYAIENAKEEVKQYCKEQNANNLSNFQNKEFDLVIAINTLHNLPEDECKFAIKEVQRIGKNAFIMNDAWTNEEEKQRMFKWNLTGLTFMHVNDWKKLFEEVAYTGDYFWFIP